MNREILFRGFCAEPGGKEVAFYNGRYNEGYWVEGFLLPFTVNCYEKNFVIASGLTADELDYYQPSIDFDEVVPETVGQFTGLYDKNGIRIFEDDIVRETRHGTIGRIRWTTGGFWCDGMFSSGLGDNLGDVVFDYQLEVIGNVYRNPELIRKIEESKG